MPLTQTANRKQFGNVEPQQRRDWTGPSSQLLYEGYAAPGVSEDTAGWVIIKHSFDASSNDKESQPKYGLIWTLRSIYDYSSP